MSQADNESYWSGNLDAQNLGKKTEFQRELDFADPPDWEWAIQPLKSSPENEHHAKQAPGPVLDMGAGLGVQSAKFAEQGHNVIAADVAMPRLLVLKANMARLSLQGRVWPVCCRAESLPFRDQSLGAFATRSVLIHTDLAAACSEAARTLQTGATVSIAEPLTGNPLVNLYRNSLAPKEWKTITRYFQADGSTEQIITKALCPLEARRWYVTGFLAFVFQFALPHRLLWRMSLAVLGLLDSAIRTVAPGLYRRMAWFVCLRGTYPGRPQSGLPGSP